MKKASYKGRLFCCDRDRIQTCNRLIRSQLLYSVELRGQHLFLKSDRDRIQTCNRLIRSQLLKSDRDRIQTCNRLIRSQLLYSVELRGLLFSFDGCKGRCFLVNMQIFEEVFFSFLFNKT